MGGDYSQWCEKSGRIFRDLLSEKREGAIIPHEPVVVFFFFFTPLVVVADSFIGMIG